MIRKLLGRIGYSNGDDAIEFIMAGICIVPPLLFLSDQVFAGAATLMFLLILLASVGLVTPAPPAPEEKKLDDTDQRPPL